MKLSNFMLGLEILRSHYKGHDGYHMGAELYMYATDEPLSTEMVAKLKELGWFQPEQNSEEYDPSNGWSAFV